MEGEVQQSSQEQLQGETTASVMQMQRLACETPESQLREDEGRLAALGQLLFRIDSQYRQIAPAHHLEIEVTPSAYYDLGGAQRFPWLREVRDGSGVRRYLTVARFVDNSRQVEPGRTILNMSPIIGPRQVPQIGLAEVSHGMVKVGKALHPRDILNITIARDTPRVSR